MDIPAVTLDHDRTRRCGFPEAIFGEGKSLATLRGIIAEQLARGDEVLVTRVCAETAAALCAELPELRHTELARTLRASPQNATRKTVGKVVIVTAGTTDLPVAEEARETLEWMGVATTMVHDVGVAGPHRLPARLWWSLPVWRAPCRAWSEATSLAPLSESPLASAMAPTSADCRRSSRCSIAAPRMWPL